MAIKDWKKAKKSTIIEFEQEGDKIYYAWEKNGKVLFVTDSPKGFRVGSKWISQMDYPKSIKVLKTKSQALKFAKEYMRKH